MTWANAKIKRIMVWKNWVECMVYPINFATQWPCPDGFHIPLKSEWEAVNNAGIALWAWSSSNGSWLKTYLKMPYCWDRNRTTSNIEWQGSWGNYWVSLADSSDTRLANAFAFDSTYTVVWWKYRTTWLCIRAFRNNPIVPDSSWTVLKQWTWTAWIYYNSTLWLISISSDGTTWYTLADKNLWATTVYNDGNTLSEANCGKYYQFWNNYWFPFTWSVTTSSSQVNAGSYWPWNYYSSSTFIIYSTWAWDSSWNNNLRWWVDWNVPN